ncbi:MAG: hypothetical protein Q8M83_06195 [bacterium]|nr:hypothetical protein [bacterium]
MAKRKDNGKQNRQEYDEVGTRFRTLFELPPVKPKANGKYPGPHIKSLSVPSKADEE